MNKYNEYKDIERERGIGSDIRVIAF